MTGDARLMREFSSTSGHLRYQLGIAQQTDGKFIVAGEAGQSAFGVADVCLIRFNNNGTIDSSFGTNGHFITPISAGEPSAAFNVVLQPNAKIVIAGVYTDNVSLDDGMVVCRYNNTISTSVADEMSNENDYSIFPIPFQDRINIFAAHNIDRAELYSVEGKLLKATKVEVGNNFIEANNLPVGMYQLKLITKEQIIIKKIIKN